MKDKFGFWAIILLISCIGMLIWNLSTGFIPLSISDFINQSSLQHGIAELRINRVLGMFLAGVAIPTAGLLLQEYFQNPLAGPSVLGISSVASLSVACYLLISGAYIIPSFLNNGMLSLSAILGSLVMMFALLILTRKFTDKSFVIIFGFLISALAGAVISILQLYSNNENLKNFILWSFGANSQANSVQILLLAILVLIGLGIAFTTIKPLIGSSLGNQYAESLGINLSKLKIGIVISTSLLSASVTAFLGPILFIGIIVPHFCRMLYNPSKLWHQWVLNMLMGTFILLLFSTLSELLKLPINILSSLFGIPVIAFMLFNPKNTRSDVS